MMIPLISSDATGHSRFGEVELIQKERGAVGVSAGMPGTALQDVAYWQMSLNEPGDFIDYQTTGINKVIAVLSGQMDITISNGEVIRLCRGDMLFQTDTVGQGHQVRFVGLEPCLSLQIAMHGGLT